MSDYQHKAQSNEKSGSREKSDKFGLKQTLSQFIDNRPESVAQQKLKNGISNSAANSQVSQFQSISGTEKPHESWYAPQPPKEHIDSSLTIEMNEKKDVNSVRETSVAQLAAVKAAKGWKWNSSFDNANPKQEFANQQEVLDWEIKQGHAVAPPAPAPAEAEDEDDAEDDAEADDENNYEEGPEPYVSENMTEHYEDHEDGFLPTTSAKLVKYSKDNYHNFRKRADGKWEYDIAEYNTSTREGWRMRRWIIVMLEDGKIIHYGPTK